VSLGVPLKDTSAGGSPYVPTEPSDRRSAAAEAGEGQWQASTERHQEELGRDWSEYAMVLSRDLSPLDAHDRDDPHTETRHEQNRRQGEPDERLQRTISNAVRHDYVQEATHPAEPRD
jgi:hypothetical protein